MILRIRTTLAAVAAVAMMATGASAATVTVGAFPLTAEANPLADVINGGAGETGAVFENVTDSVVNVRLSPWVGTALDGSAYTSISGNASATYTFSTLMSSVSFLWGSPDSYNDLDIILSGSGVTETINGLDIGSPFGSGAKYVTISDVGLFDSLTFRSTTNAFEFANLSVTPVPVPAAMPLLLVGLAGFGVMRRRSRSADA